MMFGLMIQIRNTTTPGKKNRKGKDWKSAESMMHRLYEYGFVINYNTKQVKNKGSAKEIAILLDVLRQVEVIY